MCKDNILAYSWQDILEAICGCSKDKFVLYFKDKVERAKEQAMTIREVIFRIAVIILLIEMAIMVAFSVVEVELPGYAEVFIDAFSLVLLSTPIIYVWVIKPFVDMRDRAIKEVSYLASNDPLTGLPNREKFLTVLEHMLKMTMNEGTKIAVLLLDMNRFKVIHDTFGHSISNQVIKHVADKLQSSVGEEALIARVGPDQFAILVQNKQSDDALFHLAKRILSIIEVPIAHERHLFSMEACIGISEFPKDADNAEVLLKYANNAMRKAKSSEQDSIAFFTADLTETVHKHFVLEENMRQALVHEEFFLLYQPKIETSTNALIGVEALIRWRHPERGLVSPAEFIPLAEKSGLIIPIGQWVLREALRQQLAWQEEGRKPIVMSINVSGRELNAEQVRFIIETLENSPVQRQYIDLELTETYLMKNVEASRRLLEQLHASGVSISLDDFGSGYSSLGYLKQFKIDTLKIDQLLIRDIEEDAHDFNIAKAIVGIGHTLGLKVVAEGVETEQQLGMLKSIGCDYAQGYYFSKPVSAAEIYRGQRYSF